MTVPVMDIAHRRALSVRQLLSLNLRIPPYQRPYKWTEKQVMQLFLDLQTFHGEVVYRLGTVVFHHGHEPAGERWLDIVDGQQRTLTLLLMVQALIAKPPVLKSVTLREQLNALGAIKQPLTFSSQVSIRNLRQNYQTICRLVQRGDFDESLIDFLLNRCEVVCFTLDDISEAFQFFDSQNARGRDLEPHDLLKAYHLREFDPADDDLKTTVVEGWENSKSQELAKLFGQYLYRVRRWVKGDSARYFGKDDVALFKGVNLVTSPPYPYVQQLRIAHHWVDQYNQQPDRRIDLQCAAFPFHFDQTIVNGRRFFEMATHYQRMVETVKAGKFSLDGKAQEVLKTLDSYPGRHRKGDRYVRGMFDCLVMYYLDRFATEDIGRAIEKAFVWAYHVRLERHAVHLATVDNHVLEHNLFRVIQAAARPREVFLHPLPATRINRENETELLALFEVPNVNE